MSARTFTRIERFEHTRLAVRTPAGLMMSGVHTAQQAGGRAGQFMYESEVGGSIMGRAR